MIQVKRVYDPPQRADGARYLVERLWPRGMSKESAALTGWLKEVAPSTELRTWYGHDPERWPELQKHYREELKDDALQEALAKLRQAARKGLVTLVYAATTRSRTARSC